MPDFRRLCIFKGEKLRNDHAESANDFIIGIYPREPRNKKKASKSSTPSTTFYYTKDIQYLFHEPLLAKFREHKALSKKIARSLGRGEAGDAAKLEKKNTSKLSLDHIIKERYPTFVDALRDLDDALSLLSLFANLPSTPTVPPKIISLCQRLCLEFQHYLIVTHSLRKSFLSIKGIYYQATIQGQDVMWLVPYKFVQRVTGDVDFRIMSTFVEFYTTLLGFINYRLYTTVGLVYPPKFDVKSDEEGGEFGAFKLEGREILAYKGTASPMNSSVNGENDGEHVLSEATKDQISRISDSMPAEDGASRSISLHASSQDTDSSAIDSFQPITSDADILSQPQKSSDEISTLFSPFTFYISRETPRQPLEFLLRAFGCRRVGWDATLGPGAFLNNESDPTITHQIVDRPLLPMAPTIDSAEQSSVMDENTATITGTSKVKPGCRVPGRIYIQPQWIWDCINEVKLLRTDLYAPGAILPPHLSPWVKPTRGQYDPTAPLAEQEADGEAAEAEARDQVIATPSHEGKDDNENALGDESDGVNASSKTAKTLPLTKTIEESDQGHREDDRDEEHGMTVALAGECSSDSSSEADDGPTFDGLSPSPPPQAEGPNARSRHQLELEAEAARLPPPPSAPPASSMQSSTTARHPALKGILKSSRSQAPEVIAAAVKRKQAEDREAADELERRKMMLSRKKRKVYEKVAYSRSKADAEARALRDKRRRIERERPATRMSGVK